MEHTILYLANISWAMVTPIPLLSAPWFVLLWLRSKRKRSLNLSAKLTELDLSDYPRHDPEFFEETKVTFEKLSFLYLGDVARKAAILNGDDNEIPFRLMISPCFNHVIAFSRYKFSGLVGLFFHKYMKRDYYETVEIYSKISNGEFTITTNSIPSGKTTGLENHNRLHVSKKNSLENLYLLHQTRLAHYLKKNPQLKPLKFETRYEVYIAVYEIFSEISDAWKNSKYSLTKKEQSQFEARRYDQSKMMITNDMLDRSLKASQGKITSPLLPDSMVDSRSRESATKNKDEWYYSMSGQKHGPVTIQKLRKLINTGSVKATDLAWTSSMPEWAPTYQIPDLETLKETLLPKDTAYAKFHRVQKNNPESFNKIDGQNRPGIRRLYYWIWTAPAILLACFSDYLSQALHGFIPTDIILLLSAFVMIYAIGSRLTNLSMHYLWTLVMVVPFLNLWLGYKLACHPPGYGEHKTKDIRVKKYAKGYWVFLILLASYLTFRIYQFVTSL